MVLIRELERFDLFGCIWNLNVGGPVDAVYDDSHDLGHGKIAEMAERSCEDFGAIFVLFPGPGDDVLFVFLNMARSEPVPDQPLGPAAAADDERQTTGLQIGQV